MQAVDVSVDSRYQAFPRAVHLCQTKPTLGMQQLAVKIGKFDGISIHEANLSYPGAGEICGSWASKTSKTDNQD